MMTPWLTSFRSPHDLPRPLLIHPLPCANVAKQDPKGEDRKASAISIELPLFRFVRNRCIQFQTIVRFHEVSRSIRMFQNSSDC